MQCNRKRMEMEMNAITQEGDRVPKAKVGATVEQSQRNKTSSALDKVPRGAKLRAAAQDAEGPNGGCVQGQRLLSGGRHKHAEYRCRCASETQGKARSRMRPKPLTSLFRPQC